MEISTATILWNYRKVTKTEGGLTAGEHEIRIRLTQNREPKYISVGYSSSVELWDEASQLPLPGHPKYKQIVQKITSLLNDIDFEIKLAKRNGTGITHTAIKETIQNKDKVHSQVRTKIIEFFDQVITDLDEEGRPGYADVIESARNKVNKFLKGKDKSFSSFTGKDHEHFDKFIKKTNPSASTLSFYLRNYYHIWNLAEDKKIITREQHPSNFIKSKPYKKIKTKKRTMPLEFFNAMMKIKYPAESRLWRSQKYAMFSYYARGMNFGDMCKLKHTDIKNDQVEYNRSKNGRQYVYQLHPKAMKIVNLFKDYPMQSDANYVFPILMQEHDTPRKIKQRIKSALRLVNEDLKIMASKVGLELEVSSYYMRHLFASVLKKMKVPTSIIQETLGHETEEQTQVYLEEIDDTEVAKEVKRALK